MEVDQLQAVVWVEKLRTILESW